MMKWTALVMCSAVGVAPVVRAAVVPPTILTDVRVGADGADGDLSGEAGEVGYYFTGWGGETLVVNGAAVTGGNGGNGYGRSYYDPETGEWEFFEPSGGLGASALVVQASELTFNFGSATGGNGGKGVMYEDGGPAVQLYQSVAHVYGGTFRGGEGAFAGGAWLLAPDFSVEQGSTLILYGTFDVPAGTVLTQSVTVTGMLANNTTPATYAIDIPDDAGGSVRIVAAAPVPEPASVALLALGGLGLLARPRRRRTRP